MTNSADLMTAWMDGVEIGPFEISTMVGDASSLTLYAFGCNYGGTRY